MIKRCAEEEVRERRTLRRVMQKLFNFINKNYEIRREKEEWEGTDKVIENSAAAAVAVV